MQLNQINVCSLFRDSQVWHKTPTNQVDRYFTQLLNQTYPFSSMKIYAMEGDSLDNTYEKLQGCKDLYSNVSLFKQDSDNPHVASVENEGRLNSLTKVADSLLDKVDSYSDCGYTLWIESDLIIDNNLVMNLLNSAEYYRGCKKPIIVAPSIYLGKQDGVFYDIWGFRYLDGKRFEPHTRHRKALEVASVGSCALISNELLKDGLRFSPGAFVGLCERARTMGAKVIADGTITIFHPAQQLKNMRWV